MSNRVLNMFSSSKLQPKAPASLRGSRAEPPATVPAAELSFERTLKKASPKQTGKTQAKQIAERTEQKRAQTRAERPDTKSAAPVRESAVEAEKPVELS